MLYWNQEYAVRMPLKQIYPRICTNNNNKNKDELSQEEQYRPFSITTLAK
jgi:hypothetical protein